MPYDYPGEYAMRFDGVDVGRFENLRIATPGPKPATVSPPLGRSGPGTLELHQLGGVSVYGKALLEQWRAASERSGAVARNVTIELLDRNGSPTSRWLVRNAKAVTWVLNRGQADNAIAIETLTIVHEGFIPVR